MCLKCFSGGGPWPADSLRAQAHCSWPPLLWGPRWYWYCPVYSPDLPPDIFQLFSKLHALPSRSMLQSITHRLWTCHRGLPHAVGYRGAFRQAASEPTLSWLHLFLVVKKKEKKNSHSVVDLSHSHECSSLTERMPWIFRLSVAWSSMDDTINRRNLGFLVALGYVNTEAWTLAVHKPRNLWRM